MEAEHATRCPVCLEAQPDTQQINSAEAMEGGPMFNTSHRDSALHFRCKNCGEFIATTSDCVNLANPSSKWERFQLSALIREQSISKRPLFWLQYGMEPYGSIEWYGGFTAISVEELLGQWPKTVPDRINRLLINLARMSEYGGQTVEVRKADRAIAFADNPAEASFYIDALRKQQFLEPFLGNDCPSHTVTLSALGWAKVEALTLGGSDSLSPVFVAMWFGGEDDYDGMISAYRNGFDAAICDAGYHSTRVDLEEHNDWIMDKVIGDIRVSPFVVADFTMHRNGVYFEAAFAKGLGLPVICTCRSDQIGDSHFDTAQLNHVVWKTPEELREKLLNRILGTIGRGSHA